MLVIGVQGCYYDVAEELYPAQQTANCDTTRGYALRVAPIIAGNCAISGCHVSNGQTPNLSTYAGVSSNIDRIRQRAIVEKTMPPTGPLTPCDQQALQQWIDAGAQNN